MAAVQPIWGQVIMRILWLSNYLFNDEKRHATGTWMGAMGLGLSRRQDCDLFNITIRDGFTGIKREDYGKIGQWILPKWDLGADGMPPSDKIDQIRLLVKEINPDIVHIWGLESYFGLLANAECFAGRKTLLELQGIQFSVANFFMGNLTMRESLRSVGIREILRNSSAIASQSRFRSLEQTEVGVIKAFKNIAYQSEWAHGYLKVLADPQARLHATRIMVRDEFMRSESRWTLHETKNVIFSLCACGKPYKGAHVLIRALAYLKNCDARYRDVQLILGGGIGRGGVRKIGYVRFLENEIKRLGLKGNVRFLGALTAEQICDQLLKASVFVHPSFIESYSLAVAEAMAIGTPCVVSNAGAMPELAVDGESALYFPSGDAVLCAERIRRILESDELAERLSKNAIQIALKRNDPEAVVKRQMEIYENLI